MFSVNYILAHCDLKSNCFFQLLFFYFLSAYFYFTLRTEPPSKSIFPNDSHNTIGIDKAVKHNIGNGTFGFSAFFEEFNKGISKNPCTKTGKYDII